jgi:hypothetical protein
MASLRGLEGAGAAAYFEGFADLLPERLKFSGRNRRPPRDPVNAMLSLGYTLLHAEAVLALYGAGLDPFVGFYHALDFGRESLACDLVEPLRVEVDQHALMLFRSEKLRAEDFSTTESGCLLGKAGRARFYAEWEPLAARLRKLLAESVSDVASAIGRPVRSLRRCQLDDGMDDAAGPPRYEGWPGMTSEGMRWPSSSATTSAIRAACCASIARCAGTPRRSNTAFSCWSAATPTRIAACRRSTS